MDSKAEQFLGSLAVSDPIKAALVAAVRAIYHDTYPALEERGIYGGIGIFMEGELMGGIFAYTNHVTVEFNATHGLADPMRCLEGKGPARRHVKLRHHNDIAEKMVGFFVKQVLGIDALQN